MVTKLKKSFIQGLPIPTKTIKVNVRVWNTLKTMKGENETFNDVIKTLLDQRTKELGNKRVKVIKYHRKTTFLKTQYKYKNIGLEFEYNDVKNQSTDFTLDLKIKKVFYGKRSLNPSVFFGLPHEKKHLSAPYLNLYLKCISLALEREFRVNIIMYMDYQFEDIALWKNIYYQNNLSMESFTQDIEDSLKLSEEEKRTERDEKRINSSTSGSIWESF